MFKHPLFWVLCVIAGMFIIAGAMREPSQHHKPEYTGDPSKPYKKAAQPKCAPPASEWLQNRLSRLLKQATEAENAVIEFRAKNDITGASEKLRELESVAQTYRALYDGFMRRWAAENNCAP